MRARWCGPSSIGSGAGSRGVASPRGLRALAKGLDLSIDVSARTAASDAYGLVGWSVLVDSTISGYISACGEYDRLIPAADRATTRQWSAGPGPQAETPIGTGRGRTSPGDCR